MCIRDRPYIVYLQGGLTFEHAAIGILGAAQEIENLEKGADEAKQTD